MNKLQKNIVTFEKKILANPILMIPLAFFVSLIFVCFFECVRARMYLSRAEEYKNSIAIEKVKENALLLYKKTDGNSAAYNCSVYIDELPAISDENYEDIIREQITPDSSLRTLHDSIVEAEKSPVFNSLVQFLPKVSEARRTSNTLREVMGSLTDYTKLDGRSEYCVGLFEVLQDVYFVADMKRPEAVSALQVGQIEDFQIQLKKAQKKFNELTIPAEFKNQHIEIANTLESLARVLQQDTDAYEKFSRKIENVYDALQKSMIDIETKASDLRDREKTIVVLLEELK